MWWIEKRQESKSLSQSDSLNKYTHFSVFSTQCSVSNQSSLSCIGRGIPEWTLPAKVCLGLSLIHLPPPPETTFPPAPDNLPFHSWTEQHGNIYQLCLINAVWRNAVEATAFYLPHISAEKNQLTQHMRLRHFLAHGQGEYWQRPEIVNQSWETAS